MDWSEWTPLSDSDDWTVKRSGLCWQVFHRGCDGHVREAACNAFFWRRITAERVRFALFLAHRNGDAERTQFVLAPHPAGLAMTPGKRGEVAT